MESHLLDILVCPLCKGPLQYDRQAQELSCKADKLAFPVRDGIPVMLESEARTLIPGGMKADSPSSDETPSATPASETPAPETKV